MASSRIIVEDPVYDEFCAKLVAKTRSIKVGDPRDPSTVIGPIMRKSHSSSLRVKDADHALQVANDTSYGLSSSVMTRDIDTALKFAEQLQAGMVHINDCTLHDEPTAPFGGVKNSGFGREIGRCGIEEMTEVKWITIQSGRRAFPF